MSKEHIDALDKRISSHLIYLAKTLETISSSDTRKNIFPYRNSFFMNFLALKDFLAGIEFVDKSYIDAYMPNFTKNSIDPKEFYYEYKDILIPLFLALDRREQFTVLLDAQKDFLKADEPELYDCLDQLVPHPLGLTAIQIKVWDDINPLLIKLDKILKDSEINTSSWSI
jgi:hypothetical protein